jgi:hypothetical protein
MYATGTHIKTQLSEGSWRMAHSQQEASHPEHHTYNVCHRHTSQSQLPAPAGVLHTARRKQIVLNTRTASHHYNHRQAETPHVAGSVGTLMVLAMMGQHATSA